MDYENDIFISYRREQHWTPWTRDLFGGLLRSYLQQELGTAPSIFVDEQLEIGQDWVNELASQLAKSRVVVAVFSRDYFFSPWCLHELDLMLERQEVHGGSLIIPMRAHDGELIPDIVDKTLHGDIEKFRVAGLNSDTPLYQEFSETLKGYAPGIAKLINAAPDFDEQWIDHHKNRFNEVFKEWKRDEVIVGTTQFKNPERKPKKRPPRLKLKP